MGYIHPNDDDFEPFDDEHDEYMDHDRFECVLGSKCLMPSPDHFASECYGVEMAEAYAKEMGDAG